MVSPYFAWVLKTLETISLPPIDFNAWLVDLIILEIDENHRKEAEQCNDQTRYLKGQLILRQPLRDLRELFRLFLYSIRSIEIQINGVFAAYSKRTFMPAIRI